jgi:uncharacterized protein YcsI (UPF0317 family)
VHCEDYMNQSSDKLGVGKTKNIIDSVRALQKEYPHYRIYMSGHSLVSIIRSRWLDNLVVYFLCCEVRVLT